MSNRDFEWLNAHHPQLQRKYGGQYVAVVNPVRRSANGRACWQRTVETAKGSSGIYRPGEATSNGVNQRIVASGRDARSVLKKASRYSPRPDLAKIPREDVMVG